jgi:hypothetical protein
MAINFMFHRLFNRGGRWHKPASLDPEAWSKFSFEMNWENLNKMYNLRKYYIEISPPFSRDAVPRMIEMESLHDDIMYFHIKRSWGYLLAWIVLTGLILDLDEMDPNSRHFMSSDQGAQDFPKLREGYLV